MLERKDCVDERQFDTLTRGCAVTVTHKNAEAASIASIGIETDDAKLRATFRNGKMIIWRAASCGAVMKIRSVDPTISPGFDFDFQVFFVFHGHGWERITDAMLMVYYCYYQYQYRYRYPKSQIANHKSEIRLIEPKLSRTQR